MTHNLLLITYYRCDGQQHCPDNEDEQICHNVNNANFICNDGSLIEKASRMCDGDMDCKCESLIISHNLSHNW